MKKIFALMMVAMFANSTKANAATLHAASNEMTQKIYQNAKNNHKVVYETDAQGRVISKTSYRLNLATQEYIPMSRYSVTFEDGKARIMFAAWDSESQSFCKCQALQILNQSDYPEVFHLPKN